ncbi:sugar-binding transcriptional regulator [Tianweitania sp. Rool2]|uniref:Sugar-binding transcriptional regulator n=2 Tax=Oryzicola mucosus TaxID=2767425 RepID=A0A8J6TXU2_9HYPH|nr:sugar-binding transcriptional regulator [Oryzicola mucosus]
MTMSGSRLDDAARAAWLYYVAGNTQDQIAAKLGVSRQSAQRLVSLAQAEGLVKVRIDHPIAQCLTLSRQLADRFGLAFVEVVPSDPGSDSTTLGVAQATGAEIERWLRREDPTIIAMGTGRTLKAAIEQLPPIECPQHKVVSLTGNIAPDGSAAFYNVVFTMADTVKSRSFPMPLPVIVSSLEERTMLQGQPMIRATLDLAAQAHVAFIGIGDLSDSAPLYLDGFITRDDLSALQQAGAVGEIVGRAFDAEGRVIEGLTNDRVASAVLPDPARCTIIASAMGRRKLPAIAAAIQGKMINGLITDETTAEALLQHR